MSQMVGPKSVPWRRVGAQLRKVRNELKNGSVQSALGTTFSSLRLLLFIWFPIMLPFYFLNFACLTIIIILFNSNLHNSSPRPTKTPFTFQAFILPPRRFGRKSFQTVGGFKTWWVTYTWEDTLVATNRSYGKAFGLRRKTRSFWITSLNMVMAVGAQSPNSLVCIHIYTRTKSYSTIYFVCFSQISTLHWYSVHNEGLESLDNRVILTLIPHARSAEVWEEL